MPSKRRVLGNGAILLGAGLPKRPQTSDVYSLVPHPHKQFTVIWVVGNLQITKGAVAASPFQYHRIESIDIRLRNVVIDEDRKMYWRGELAVERRVVGMSLRDHIGNQTLRQMSCV